eukprot:symbB.v1.2.016933.t1/scaffold1305.1/size135414/5
MFHRAARRTAVSQRLKIWALTLKLHCQQSTGATPDNPLEENEMQSVLFGDRVIAPLYRHQQLISLHLCTPHPYQLSMDSHGGHRGGQSTPRA